MSEALPLLLRVNLAVAVAVAVTMLLRLPARRLFGPRVAYGLWLLAPFAAASMLLPARVVTLTQPNLPPPTALSWIADAGSAATPRATWDLFTILSAVWAIGALAALAHLVWRQITFGRAMRAGCAGPAVVGILRPRIVTPADFAERYTAREQRVVLAHEETHIARRDPLVNGLVALARCVNWFNPLVHLLAHTMRIDQELACDAQVVAAHPATRRSYAEAMLKTQLAAQPLPLGCHWRAPGAHPLAERIALLSHRSPGRAARAFGAATMMLTALAGACGTWAARPPQIVLIPAAAPRPAWTSNPTTPAVETAAAPTSGLAVRAPALERVSLPVASAGSEPAVDTPAPAGLTEVTDDPAAAGPERRLLPPGAFGPSKVRGIANWSSVEPGLAVRVLATMTDPDGVPLTTDLTSFGSQSRYRLGYIERNSSRFKLFTKVEQHGDRLLVTAGLNRPFTPMLSGTIELAEGETGTIRLPTGQLVTVTATVRPETPEEIAEARGRARIEVLRGQQAS